MSEDKKVYLLSLESDSQETQAYTHGTEQGMYRRAAMAIRGIWEDEPDFRNALMRRFCTPGEYDENLPKVREFLVREDYSGLVGWWQDWGHDLEVCPMYVWCEAQALGD